MSYKLSPSLTSIFLPEFRSSSSQLWGSAPSSGSEGLSGDSSDLFGSVFFGDKRIKIYRHLSPQLNPSLLYRLPGLNSLPSAAVEHNDIDRSSVVSSGFTPPAQYTLQPPPGVALSTSSQSSSSESVNSDSDMSEDEIRAPGRLPPSQRPSQQAPRLSKRSAAPDELSSSNLFSPQKK